MTISPQIEALVSVQMITYNHERYIAQAIEGVVTQKTTFRIELVIGEDCSTDSTRKICEDYEKKYPEIIKLLPSEKNIGMDKNGLRTLQECNGKYIAICEGDDYWTDPYKLQKQFDFLEANEDFGLVHTNYLRYINDLKYFENNPTKKIDNGMIFRELLKENQIATLTVLLRKDLAIKAINSDIYNKGFLIGDYPLWLEISTKSKIGYLKDITSVYRVLPESASNTSDINKHVSLVRNVLEVKRYFAVKYKSEDTIIEQEILLYKHLLYLGYKNHRPDLVNEAFSSLRKIEGYKIKVIEYLYYLSSHSSIIYFLLSTFIVHIKKYKEMERILMGRII